MSWGVVRSVESGPGLQSASDIRAGISPERRRAIVTRTLLAADILSGVAVLAIFQLASAGIAQFNPAVFALDVAVLAGIFALAGLYSGLGPSPFERLRLRTLAAAVFCVYHFEMATASTLNIVLQACLLFPLLVIAGHYAEVAAAAWLNRKGLWLARVLVIGEGPRAELLIRELAGRPMLGMKPVAVFTPMASGAPGVSDGTLAGLPTFSKLDSLDTRIDLAIAVSRPSLMAFERLSGRAHEIGTVMMLAEGAPGESLWVASRSLGGGVGLEVRREGRIDRSGAIKRGLDIMLASIAAVPGAIIVGLAAAVVKLVDPGPAFFTQRRIGENGRIVDVLKVRTMYCDSERRLAEHFAASPEARTEWERYYKLRDDPRVLPVVGAFIRKSSIDELPQIWNVLRGDMSVVGPRPFPEYHLNMFDEEFRALRSSVRPGLTGLWQVSARSEGDLRIQRSEDIFYIRNRSLWMDLYIILQTIPAVLSGNGAR